ncbi:hypothetical protein [Caballeronia zhejiangensis]|uniref:DUF4760 domain-containing protein n=1 Tax=Caballeronia zhejiangensis TaxID=871203 RepID=A0A656QLQ6_9BURK|nr:hypothetical protein [Caballeronia zhejiangensis]KDR31771.1 hypothetical protein BG60_29040 [Caballeronia zhejiangensis]
MIWQFPNWTVSEWSSLITASVAPISVIGGLVLQWRISKRQSIAQERIAARVAADNISAMRQAWINEVRDDCAEYFQLLARLASAKELKPDNPDEQKAYLRQLAEAAHRSAQLTHRIRLRLNPNETEHELLRDALNGLIVHVKGQYDEGSSSSYREYFEEMERLRGKATMRLQKILKSEWERIKRGD